MWRVKIHIVKKGDSLFSIAQKYNVSLEEVLQLNPSIMNPDVIEVGMKVKIPTSKPGDMEIMHQHVVKQGDSLWKLSKAWGVPLSEMIKANPQLKNPNVLLTGEVVNIPKASSPSMMPEMNHEHSSHEMTQQGSGQHHPLHPLSMMQGVQGLVGKMSTAPFIGKKPTGQKPLTAPIATSVPTPMPTPLPEPVPTPMPVMPIMQKPVEKYPVHIQYEKHIDLFQQYGVPATEVMSLYEMPKMPEAVSPVTQVPHYGYGYEQPMTSPVSAGGYGYPHVMPTAVSPAQTSPDWCPPEDVAGASNLPWGAPAPMPYGSMLSPAGMEDCGPEWVSPADVGPHGYGGYGYEQPTAVSPAAMGPQGYGHGSYGYEQPTAVSPAAMGPQGYGYGSYGYEQPTAVSPAAMGPQGYGHGSYGYEQPTAVSPASMGPQGYGYGGYGYEQPTAVSPASMGPQGYGHGSYGYEQPTAVSPASMGPQGYGYGSYGYEQPTAVSPASAGPMGMPYPGYTYAGYGQMAPVQSAGANKKPCDCGCKDKREEQPASNSEEDRVDLVNSIKSVASRKPVKKTAVRKSRPAQPKRRGSAPWINN
jgi:morphogenetic protein associated with SpoVID